MSKKIRKLFLFNNLFKSYLGIFAIFKNIDEYPLFRVLCFELSAKLNQMEKKAGQKIILSLVQIRNENLQFFSLFFITLRKNLTKIIRCLLFSVQFPCKQWNWFALLTITIFLWRYSFFVIKVYRMLEKENPHLCREIFGKILWELLKYRRLLF